MTIGVISDTHGLLRPEAVEALAGVDHILHAGDVGDARILERLRAIAPLTAIRGNVDTQGVCGALPATEAVELGGRLFYLVHSLDDLDISLRWCAVKSPGVTRSDGNYAHESRCRRTTMTLHELAAHSVNLCGVSAYRAGH